MQTKTFYPFEVLVEPAIGKVYNIVDEYAILMKLALLSQFVETNLTV
jgi:hypothetical protein